MELTTLYKQYRAAKLAADQAAKEEDKLKKALKKAMEEAGVKNYTDEDGFLFERIVQNRKSMDERDIKIKRSGAKGSMKTTYQYFPKDKTERELPEKQNLVGSLILDLSPEDQIKAIEGRLEVKKNNNNEGGGSSDGAGDSRNCGKSIFSGKIYCAKCGAKYWRSLENGYVKFKCSSYSKYGKIPGKGCDNKSFSENALYSILQSLSEQIVEVNTAEVRKSLLNWLESLRERLRASQGDDTIKEEIRKQTARKEKLTDHLDATFDNTLGKNEDGSTSIRYDYFNLDDKNIFRDHEPLIAPAPPCPDGNHFYYREKKLSFTKLEDVYKRALQAAKKGREFTFHWRGGYLTREVLADLVDQIQAAGKTRDKKAIITLNWPQAVLRFHFVEQQAEGKVFIEEVNEGEKL